MRDTVPPRCEEPGWTYGNELTKESYHFAPDWIHWHGNAPLKLDLLEILDEENMLRRLNEVEKKRASSLSCRKSWEVSEAAVQPYAQAGYAA
jgi:hypothetical protein